MSSWASAWTSRSVRLRLLVSLAIVVATVLSSVGVSLGLRLDPNVASLLPARGEGMALRRFLRAFGGSDLGVVLVQADESELAGRVAEQVAVDLRALPSVRFAAAGVELGGGLDPMLAWRHADAAVRSKLSEALSPEGMRARLRESRAMLLAPGAGAASEMIARDPLRLAQLLAESGHLHSGLQAQADGSFATEDGRERLVLVRPAGQALRGDDARAFVADARGVLARARAANPGVRLGLTGGHAIAEATERMLIRDLTLSGSLSLLLAALAFAVTFPRLRALAAVMPPLVLGTLWTAGIAAILPAGLSTLAVAFMSVVVGVGVDTGVHVYDSLLEARREGLAPADAAAACRRRTARPVLVAALTGAVAFGSLALSDIAAIGQLGVLSAAGELLTAVAILWVTPEIGGWLERGPAPARRRPAWTTVVWWLTATRPRAALLAALALMPIGAIALGQGPHLADSILAVRPRKLEPLEVQDEIYRAFGGQRGQWVVLVTDRDPEQARARADRLSEQLGRLGSEVGTVDSLTAVVPAPATQRARLAERDGLDLPAKADELARALGEVGFAPERFVGALDAMRHPSHELVSLDSLRTGSAAIFVSRFLAQDGPDTVVALYLQPSDNPAARKRLEADIRRVDPAAEITGYSRLDATLRATLLHDMPRIGIVACVLVLLALLLALRKASDVLLAMLVVVSEVAIVLLAIRVLGIPLHAYDALVIPVLFGITVDEGMFLLHRARAAPLGGSAPAGTDWLREVLSDEGPPVAATALTTSAGFGALALCQFDGLRHLGMVGALGSAVGLAMALILVPAGLRLLAPRAR